MTAPEQHAAMDVQAQPASSLLSAHDLGISLPSKRGELRLLDGISFDLPEGGALGLVGESGSGKSLTALAVMGLLDARMRTQGSLRFEGRELLTLPQSELRRIRGSRMALVFQDSLSSLNPYLSIGEQMIEGLQAHAGVTRTAALAEAQRLLDAVRIAEPARRLTQYPHELSGGMRQRVMLAMSLMTRPRLLIADEPTTALDVTVQAQIVRLLADLRRDFGMALLLITHDLALVAEVCDDLAVLYGGRLMERGPVEMLLRAPAHPYTAALLHARPRREALDSGALPTIAGQPPLPQDRLAGCRFAPRCPSAQTFCHAQPPTLLASDTTHRACHFPLAHN